jgi:uncharacterized membrane protein
LPDLQAMQGSIPRSRPYYFKVKRIIAMDNTFLKELSQEEARLVEKLRVLREFKAKFFEDGKEVAESVLIDNTTYQTSTSQEPRKENKKNYNKRKKRNTVTVQDKVLHALSTIEIGKTRDVVDKLIEIYPEYKTDARYYMSALSIAKRIDIYESGIGNSGNTYKYKK